jgi:hypothetical protein
MKALPDGGTIGVAAPAGADPGHEAACIRV